MNLIESFEDGYEAEPNSGCWLWARSRNNSGYGKFCGVSAGKWVLAHRFSYELHVGPVPEVLVLDHKCRTRSCVNPRHLEPVTRTENTRRGRWAHVAQTGLCFRGHKTVFVRGRNYCRECNALWHAKKEAL